MDRKRRCQGLDKEIFRLLSEASRDICVAKGKGRLSGWYMPAFACACRGVYLGVLLPGVFKLLSFVAMSPNITPFAHVLYPTSCRDLLYAWLLQGYV